MIAWYDWVTFGAVASVFFVFGWVARSYLEARRKAAALHLRRVTGARSVVARPGTTPAKVRQASLTRGDIGDRNIGEQP